MKLKCKMVDLVDDLVNVFDVTEITMDDSGIGFVVAEALKEKGVVVKNRREKMKLKTLKDLKLTKDFELTMRHEKCVKDRLRQEVIKWIKEELKIGGIYTKSLLRWRERFNLTDEDLK